MSSAMRTIYHKETGAATIYTVDAHAALAAHPKEWSAKPWLAEGEKEVVEIPDDWQDGKPSERIALAVKLGAERKGLTAAKADDVIEDEVERRKAAAETPFNDPGKSASL